MSILALTSPLIDIEMYTYTYLFNFVSCPYTCCIHCKTLTSFFTGFIWNKKTMIKISTALLFIVTFQAVCLM